MELYSEILNLDLIQDSNNLIKIDDKALNSINSLYQEPEKKLIKIDVDSLKQHEIFFRIINTHITDLDYDISLQHSIDFINNFFKFHDINYLENGYILKNGLPFSIEIEKENDFGYLVCHTNIEEDGNEEVIFSKIILPNYNSLILPIIYAHELTHTQLYSVIGSINNINYDEVIPIFMEYLYLYESKTQDINLIHNYFRLGDLHTYSEDILKYNKDKIINEDVLLSVKYYISTVVAYKLFGIYINSNNSQKKEILENIQKIFDGKRNIEETLKIYNLRYEKNI